MIYANWTRHKNIARGFATHEQATDFGRARGNDIGHAWRVEERRAVDVQTGVGRYEFVIHNYGGPTSLYFESLTEGIIHTREDDDG